MFKITRSPRQSFGERIAHGGVRGTIAAMAMSGMRSFTVGMGLVDRPPPDAIFKEKAPGLLRRVPASRQRSVLELTHWGYGAVGGAMFGAIPRPIRLLPWAGPVYGLVLWLGFEAGVAPVLGLAHAKKPKLQERAAFAVDHVLYGLVLSETRRRPQA